MKLYLIKTNKIYITDLPSVVSGNYWICDKDKDDELRNLINVSVMNDNWQINSNNEHKIVNSNNSVIDSAILQINSFYNIKIDSEESLAILYCGPDYDTSTTTYKISLDNDITIGNVASNNICYDIPFIGEKTAKISFKDGKKYITDLGSKTGVYVNNNRITESIIENGDVIFIMGLRLVIIGDLLLGNNPFNKVIYSGSSFQIYSEISSPIIDDDTEVKSNIELYSESDYFSKAPRFQTVIEKQELVIDPPPAKENQEEQPLIYTIGPMVTMSMTSLITGYVSLTAISKGDKSISTALPTLIMAAAMICGTILWPLLTKNYTKKQKINKEKLRQEKYNEYIQSKCTFIDIEMKKQRQILNENYISNEECEKIILSKNRKLWERKLEDEDFLSVRLGIGTIPLEIDIKYPEEHFSLEDDNLKRILSNLVEKSSDLTNVPIGFSFAEKYISAVVGKWDELGSYIKGILLQLVTFHSYEDLKLVFLINEKHTDFWEFAKTLPHTWNNEKSFRFFSNNYDEMKEVSAYLERMINSRIDENNNGSYKDFSDYYMIITDDYSNVKSIGIINKVLEQKSNIGFSVLILNDNLSTLPDECSTFISIANKNGGIFESKLSSDKQKEFTVDEYMPTRMEECSKILSNIPIKIAGETFVLPTIYEFLEMYNAGKVEQLNVLQRWKLNNSVASLQAPIGIDSHGMLFKLDVHEKIHGPHGLIAGMTGSGKSELIITYILSMAINYHPDDVSFVLIDYKGGGLTGAFRNEETGIKLPHLAGTITNLDTGEINRALTSIQSELRRRQAIFNEAREKLNEGVIDIYKYQKLYHEGLVSEPVPHLLIISDEFAELKANQPDFMDQLISTARIGRSLGVHLILATQKPSGVVNDQIWSNSRFRICLKVQEKSDSNDMIKRPDAALLKQTGRFYLQVGYDEYFELGQSAWCGAKYVPKDKVEKKTDDSIDFINNLGYVVKDVKENKVVVEESHGEQLNNVVKYLSDIAKKENINIKQLWLEKIPAVIYVEALKQKYNYVPQKCIINPIIGEYDDPDNQYQGLLTLPIYEGNTLIYGMPGSGKDITLNTTIYSIITNYTTEEANIYILDFGGEALKIFSKVPHVGDILYVNDEEKIDNLFKMLTREIERRKILFSDYNGDYNTYIKYSNKLISTIIVIINNYEVMTETYSKYDDILSQITREGVKYGIMFILTVSSSNAVRYRLAGNFRNKLVLQLNEEYGYSSIISSAKKMQPSEIKGRGIVELNGVFEFQTAYMCNPENQIDFIRNLTTKLSENNKAVKCVPTLPSKVSFNDVNDNITINSIPIGIEKDSLTVSKFDFKQKFTSLIVTSDLSLASNFVKSLAFEFLSIKTNLIVIDAEEVCTNEDFKVNYFNSDFDSVYEKIFKTINDQYKIYVDNNYNKKSLEGQTNITCMILGINDFKNKLSDDNKKSFDSLFEKGKDLGTFNFIIVDLPDKLKKMEYDSWYKNSVTNNRGIWLGNGIANQYVIKLNKIPRELYEEIPNDFGYVIEKGYALLIKTVNFY